MSSLFAAILKSPNIYFAIVMFSVFILGVVKRKSTWGHHIPGMLTSIGIIGTFFGLFSALQAFDEKDINSSVPLLMEGIKTKFVVSLVGLVLALTLKGILLLFGGTKRINQNATLGDLLSVLHESAKAQAEQSEVSNRHLVDLKIELANQLGGMQREFRTFSERMASDNSKALIEALKEVIRDFNAKISEQFGDNFKELNLAVGRLLEWQDRNKSEMERIYSLLDSTHEATSRSASAIEAAEGGLQVVRSSMSQVIEMSKNVGPALEKINEDSKTLTRAVGDFAELGKQAETAFPLIRKELESVTEKISDNFANFGRNMESVFYLQSREIDRLSKAMFENASRTQSQTEAALREIVGKTTSQIERVTKDQEEIIKNQLAALDKALEEELTKALRSLGTNLANLSEKFVSDYLPLTEQLRNVVQLAERIKAS